MKVLDILEQELQSVLKEVMYSLGFSWDGEKYVGKWGNMTIEIHGSRLVASYYSKIMHGYTIKIRVRFESSEHLRKVEIDILDDKNLPMRYTMWVRDDVFDIISIRKFMTFIKIIDDVVRRVRAKILEKMYGGEL